jgi:hypothetical protein
MNQTKSIKSKTKKTTTGKAAAVKKAASIKEAPAMKFAPARKTIVRVKTMTADTMVSGRIVATEVIAARAYILWEQAGRPNGRDVEYWLQAENQLKQEQSFAA